MELPDSLRHQALVSVSAIDPRYDTPDDTRPPSPPKPVSNPAGTGSLGRVCIPQRHLAPQAGSDPQGIGGGKGGVNLRYFSSAPEGTRLLSARLHSRYCHCSPSALARKTAICPRVTGLFGQ